MKPLQNGKAMWPYEPEQTGECRMESKVNQPFRAIPVERITPTASVSPKNKTGDNFEKASSLQALSPIMESHAEVLKRAKDAVHS